jgi:membrane-bound inhibitor of C-type lysozyme
MTDRRLLLAGLSGNFVYCAGIVALIAAADALTGSVFAQTPGAAPAAGAKAPAAPSAIRAQFTCDAGKTIAAVVTRHNVRLTLSDGRKLRLPQALSGSGARYASDNESFVFWNKGDTAFIEENGKTTYSGCITKKE